jgi:hypothetical protein
LTVRGHDGVVAMVGFHQELYEYEVAQRCCVLERGAEDVDSSFATLIVLGLEIWLEKVTIKIINSTYSRTKTVFACS